MGRPRKYLTTAQFAEYTGASPRAINAATKPGKELSDVRRKSDTKIDITHPQAVAWKAKYAAKGKGVPLEQVGAGPKPGRPPRNPTPPEAEEVVGVVALPDNIRECLDWTLLEIVSKCGTMVAFKDLLEATLKIEKINTERITSDKKSGELIGREYVRTHVLSLIEALAMRLLADVPPTLAIRLHSAAASGATIEEMQALIRKSLEREIKGVKDKTRKRIKNAQ